MDTKQKSKLMRSKEGRLYRIALLEVKSNPSVLDEYLEREARKARERGAQDPEVESYTHDRDVKFS